MGKGVLPIIYKYVQQQFGNTIKQAKKRLEDERKRSKYATIENDKKR